jgi:hypothetical protein
MTAPAGSRAGAVLHTLLWMAALAVAAERYTLASGMAGAALGALLGSVGGPRLAQSRLRTWALPLPALGASGAALLLAALATRWEAPARMLGARPLYALAEFVPALILPLGLVGTLEALAQRRRDWRLAGLAVLGALYASLFAAHREGFLNRPYALVDPLWGHGLDPLPWFLLLGLGLALLLALTLAGRQLGGRTLRGLGLVAAALLLAYMLLPQHRLKEIADLHRVLGEGPGGDASKPRPGPPPDSQGGKGEGRPQDPAQDFRDQSPQPADGPVAVVVFHTDYEPPLGSCYFRETAFSAFNGARLVQDAGRRFDLDLPEPGAPPLAGALGHEVRTTVAVMASHARAFGLVNPLVIRETQNPDPKRFFQAYDVTSRACDVHPRDLVGAPTGDPAWGREAWDHYTQAPSDPRYAALAASILQGLNPAYRDMPFAKALAIKIWMDRNTVYSLDTAHGDSPDPVADFLFGDRRGHCVYLAHAACMLYRAAGVPARVAAGYAANPEFRFGGASLLLRSSNAHAWPEVRLRNFGWVPLDITPARSEAPPQEAPDRGLQQMLGEMAMVDKPPPIPPPDAEPSPVKERLVWLGRILGTLLLLALAAALPVAYGVKLWRRAAPGFGPDRDVPRLAYRAALDAAAGHGLLRARGETREAFARRLQEASPAFAALTALHLRWALGAHREPPPAAPARELLRASRREFRAASPRLRRWLSPWNPLAWTRVR